MTAHWVSWAFDKCACVIAAARNFFHQKQGRPATRSVCRVACARKAQRNQEALERLEQAALRRVAKEHGPAAVAKEVRR